MELSKNHIDGSETTFSSAEEQALSKFYKAFNSGSMQLMEQSWLTNDEASMDNPIGGIRRGWTQIAEGYKKIFGGKANVVVEFYDYSIHKTEKMFFATGRERGYFKTNEKEFALAIRTTRIFISFGDEWRQIHHHGSIDDPALLKNYQEAIKGT